MIAAAITVLILGLVCWQQRSIIRNLQATVVAHERHLQAHDKLLENAGIGNWGPPV